MDAASLGETRCAWQARRSTPGIPGAGLDVGHAVRSGDVDPTSGRRLRCRTCGAAVTSADERLEVDGRHVHRRINPAGIEFEFGCFGGAPGVAVSGQPTAEFSWFAGYAWSYAECHRCGAHLGWFFEGREPAFHGLILSRLVEEDPR